MGSSFFADFADDVDFLDVIQSALLAGEKHAAALLQAARKGFSTVISDDGKRPIYRVEFKGELTHSQQLGCHALAIARKLDWCISRDLPLQRKRYLFQEKDAIHEHAMLWSACLCFVCQCTRTCDPRQRTVRKFLQLMRHFVLNDT